MTKPKQGIKPPHPAQRPWRVLERRYLDRSPWHTVRTDRVQLPTGVVVPDWYVFEFLDWVEILAITKEGKFVIISQYRHGLGETRYELPAGSCDEGETPLESAKRELFEETGIKADPKDFELLSSRRDKDSFFDFYCLKNATPIEDIVLLEGETTAAKWATFAEIREMIKNREICRIIGRQFLHQEPQLLDRQEIGYR